MTSLADKLAYEEKMKSAERVANPVDCVVRCNPQQPERGSTNYVASRHFGYACDIAADRDSAVKVVVELLADRDRLQMIEQAIRSVLPHRDQVPQWGVDDYIRAASEVRSLLST